MKFISVLKNEKILSPDNICSLYHREYCDTGDKGMFVNVQNRQYWRLLRKIAENIDEDIPIDKEPNIGRKRGNYGRNAKRKGIGVEKTAWGRGP